MADLYRWWYERLGRPTNRLLVESSVHVDPMWALRTGSVPFWLPSAMESDYELLRGYLESVDPYEFIHLSLAPPGGALPGVVPLDRWDELLLRHAVRQGRLLGVDPEEYPTGLGSTARYHEEVRRIPSRQPLPGPLSISDVGGFLGQAPPRYRLTWN